MKGFIGVLYMSRLSKLKFKSTSFPDIYLLNTFCVIFYLIENTIVVSGALCLVINRQPTSRSITSRHLCHPETEA